jgi:hypothetical protein
MRAEAVHASGGARLESRGTLAAARATPDGLRPGARAAGCLFFFNTRSDLICLLLLRGTRRVQIAAAAWNKKSKRIWLVLSRSDTI